MRPAGLALPGCSQPGTPLTRIDRFVGDVRVTLNNCRPWEVRTFDLVEIGSPGFSKPVLQVKSSDGSSHVRWPVGHAYKTEFRGEPGDCEPATATVTLGVPGTATDSVRLSGHCAPQGIEPARA